MSGYTDAQKAEVIEAALQSISTGQSLRSFCIQNELPYATVWGWINPDGLTDNSPYARARDTGTHYLADECLDISDELLKPLVPVGVDPALAEFASPPTEPMVVEDRVKVAKVRIDTRLRLIGKWNRRDYGEKQEVDHRSSDGSMTPKPNVIEFVSPVTGDAGQN